MNMADVVEVNAQTRLDRQDENDLVDRQIDQNAERLKKSTRLVAENVDPSLANFEIAVQFLLPQEEQELMHELQTKRAFSSEGLNNQQKFILDGLERTRDSIQNGAADEQGRRQVIKRALESTESKARASIKIAKEYRSKSAADIAQKEVDQYLRLLQALQS